MEYADFVDRKTQLGEGVGFDPVAELPPLNRPAERHADTTQPAGLDSPTRPSESGVTAGETATYDWLGDLKHLLACPDDIETFARQFANRVNSPNDDDAVALVLLRSAQRFVATSHPDDERGRVYAEITTYLERASSRQALSDYDKGWQDGWDDNQRSGT